MTNTTSKFHCESRLDQKVLRFSLSSELVACSPAHAFHQAWADEQATELVDQINTLARFRGRENWTILRDDGSLNGYQGIQYQLNKICFDL